MKNASHFALFVVQHVEAHYCLSSPYLTDFLLLPIKKCFPFLPSGQVPMWKQNKTNSQQEGLHMLFSFLSSARFYSSTQDLSKSCHLLKVKIVSFRDVKLNCHSHFRCNAFSVRSYVLFPGRKLWIFANNYGRWNLQFVNKNGFISVSSCCLYLVLIQKWSDQFKKSKHSDLDDRIAMNTHTQMKKVFPYYVAWIINMHMNSLLSFLKPLWLTKQLFAPWLSICRIVF